MSFARSRSARRSLAALGAAALMAPVLPMTASAAAALPPTQDPREFACPPGQVPDAGFTDITDSLFRLEINCLAGYQITSGVTADRYDAHAVVTRVQMAQFVARVLTLVAGVPLDTRDAGFTDLDGVSASAKDAINGLANAGIVSGTSATTFSPRDGIKRDQMATFLAKLQDVVGVPFAAGEDYFADDEDSAHEGSVNQLAGAGIVTGTGAENYSPRGSVTRQQMSGFLMRYVEDRTEAGEFEGRYERDNNVLDVTPSEQASLPARPGESGDDVRDYLVSGLRDGVQYEITLIEAGTVREEDGVTRLTDVDDDNLADVGKYTADIVSVNGAAVRRTNGGPTAPSTATATPSNGQITFTIGGEAEESVRPVVYTAGGRSPSLELAGDDRPIEAFGLGGVTAYTSPLASNTDGDRSGIVQRVDKEAGAVVIDIADVGPMRYSYDPSDNFTIENQTVTPTQFAAELSRGDTLEVGAYFTETLQASDFAIITNDPTAPTSVSAEKGTEEQTSDDITITVSGGTPDPYDAYLIERALVTAPEPADEDERPTPPDPNRSYSPVTDEPIPAGVDIDPATPGFQFTFVDKDVAPGTYSYRAFGVVDGDVSNKARTDTHNETSVQPASNVRPHAVDALVSRDQASDGKLGPGDQMKIVFNERLALLDAGEKILVSDADGTVVELVHGRNALFALNPGDETVNNQLRGRERVLTIELAPNYGTGATTGGGVIVKGDPEGLQLPGTMVEQGGISDRTGLTFDVAASTDALLDLDAEDSNTGEE